VPEDQQGNGSTLVEATSMSGEHSPMRQYGFLSRSPHYTRPTLLLSDTLV
jgi:hypothetical protein